MTVEQIQKQADLVSEHVKGYLAALNWVAGEIQAEDKPKEAANANSVKKD